MLSRAFARPLAIAIALASSPYAWSAGAEVPVIAVSSQGTSNANSAEANDASVLFYNPAGMARLHGTNISQPFSLIAASTKVRDTGTTRVQDLNQAPDTGSYNANTCTQYDCMPEGSAQNPQQPGVNPQPEGVFPKVLPLGALFASTPVNDMISVGVGVFSPGGGNLNYKSDWFGRYFIDSAAIETVNINPSVSVRFDEKHSVGFGVSALVGHAKFKEQIDVTKIAPYLLQPILDNTDKLGDSIATNLTKQVAEQLLNNPLTSSALSNAQKATLTSIANGVASGAGGLLGGIVGQLYENSPQQLQGVLTGVLGDAAIDPSSTADAVIETIGFGYGWNLGYMYQFSPKTRISVSYRSRSDIRMKGDLDWNFDNLKGNGALGNVLTPPTLAEYLEQTYRPDTDARLIFTIPAKFNVGFFTELNDKLDFMLNYTFNKTSAVKNITIDLYNQEAYTAQGYPAQGNPVITQNWRDSFTAAAGFNYHWNDKLTLRTGLQFDQTPISGNQFRHPALADNDRWMASFGLGYKWNKSTTIDLAYSYMYILPSDAEFHETCTGTYYERADNSTGGASECTANGGTFRAHYYDSHAHIVGLQLNKRL